MKSRCSLVVALLFSPACESLGGTPEGDRLERIRASPQWRDDRFVNTLPRVDGPRFTMLKRWLFDGSPQASPSEPIPTLPRRRADYDSPPTSGLRVTWLGHSTLILEVDGRRFLIDPVFGPRASPFSFVGPQRWYDSPLPLDELPAIDAVIISHDHYDHLDAPTVKALGAAEALAQTRWLVPLGVGAHLESWGVKPERITELDWWQSTKVADLELTATPSRHFSGRWLNDGDETLWASWAFVGPTHRVFYSGDTALFPGFADIGERLGPFDLTMIEVGAYNALWADVHLGPEQAVVAHRLVRGKVMLPVHWGLFDLALHGWTEPIERVLVAAQKDGARVLTPKPGQLVEPSTVGAPERWWPALEWQTAEQAPVRSSHVEGLLSAAVAPQK